MLRILLIILPACCCCLVRVEGSDEGDEKGSGTEDVGGLLLELGVETLGSEVVIELAPAHDKVVGEREGDGELGNGDEDGSSGLEGFKSGGDVAVGEAVETNAGEADGEGNAGNAVADVHVRGDVEPPDRQVR